MDLSLESLLYSPVNQYFRHLERPIQPMSYFEHSGDKNENQPQPMSFKAGLLDAFSHIKESWNVDRNTAVAFCGNALLKTRDTAMEDAYADI